MGINLHYFLQYNHRNPDGKCDFEKVEGMEGIYLANFIDVEDKIADKEEAEERPKSNKRKGKYLFIFALFLILFSSCFF